jgi:hypothetical protein
MIGIYEAYPTVEKKFAPLGSIKLHIFFYVSLFTICNLCVVDNLLTITPS